ncbi:MAG: polysaccharide biosynthesis/export family protein [Pseudooceanicola sp.]|nr:polysaccharide biosynthesis/export family protein [Pseudooceanicola sp.]
MLRVSIFLSALVLALVGVGAAQAQDTYRIKPGDVLSIEVLEDSSINRQSLVLPDGRVTVPLAGTVSVSGMTVDEVRASVASKLSSNFANEPTVTVSLTQLGTPKPIGGASLMSIYFLGEVNTPGAVQVKRGTTLLQALALAGGFNRFAATKRVQLRRTDRSGKQSVYNFNYNDVLAGRNSIGATQLATGDVIVVPTRRLFE